MNPGTASSSRVGSGLPTPVASGVGTARGRALGTVAVVAVAASAWGGAALASPVSLWWCVVAGILTLAAHSAARGSAVRGSAARGSAGGPAGSGPAAGRLRTSLAVAGGCVVVGLAASALAADAWAGLNGPLPSVLDGRVQLAGDPRPTRFGVRVEVRADGRLWDLTASGGAAGVVGGLRAGESAAVTATTRRRAPDDGWRASRHVVGIATATSVGEVEAAAGPWRVANAIHRGLLRSTAHLPADARGVALGVALGDRGAISDLLAEDLRAAGLSHLTAVSGQHVVLLIAMAAPLVRRLSPRTAVLVTVVLLVGFVILTRGEPSVLRAAAMALVVAAARAGGRHVVGLRVLAVVVATLILVDPLLVWSVGFQLSVAATAGIAVGARRLAAAVPGPRPIAAVLGVSLAAQLAVAPLVIAYFGVLPLVGIGANLAVAPVIGPLMGWTLAAGAIAGVAPGLAAVLHAPTGLLGGWVSGVARWSAELGVPGLRLPQAAWSGALVVLLFVVIGLGAVVVALRRRTAGRGARGAGWGMGARPAVVGVVVVAVAVSAFAVDVPVPGRHELGVGAEAVVGGGRVVLIVDGRAAPGSVVGGLRRIGARRVDVVVARTASESGASLTQLVVARFGPSEVLAPASMTSRDVPAMTRRFETRLGAYTVVASPEGADRLEVVVGGPGPGDSPE